SSSMCQRVARSTINAEISDLIAIINPDANKVEIPRSFLRPSPLSLRAGIGEISRNSIFLFGSDHHVIASAQSLSYAQVDVEYSSLRGPALRPVPDHFWIQLAPFQSSLRFRDIKVAAFK